MVDDKWMLDEGIFYPVSGNVILHTTPGQGVWELVKDPDPRSSRLGLRKMSERFTFDFKIYETGGKEAIKDLVIKTDENICLLDSYSATLNPDSENLKILKELEEKGQIKITV